jgi:hypothetical protein
MQCNAGLDVAAMTNGPRPCHGHRSIALLLFIFNQFYRHVQFIAAGAIVTHGSVAGMPIDKKTERESFIGT